jgi:8-oxo-dGTP pyrophosphatase MutT (NUDIX family)
VSNYESDDIPIRDAATVVVIRKHERQYKVLMGQRGKKAIFMPNKFVFPGGAYEETDSQVPMSSPLSKRDQELLSLDVTKNIGLGLAATVIRELWEETGLELAEPYKWEGPPVPGWEIFHRQDTCPKASELTFFFRAITPVGRPRRFDARFFLCNSEAIRNDLDDFSRSSSELSHLQWIEIEESQNLDLPIITRIVLREVSRFIADGANTYGVPFYNEGSSSSNFSYLTLNS